MPLFWFFTQTSPHRNMIRKDDITHITEGLLDDDLFLIEVKVTPADEIEIILDSDGMGGLGLDRCVTISKEVEKAIYEQEGEDADFALTVMSAGVGQPLRLKRQYEKLIANGKEVDIVYKTGKKQTGAILTVDEQGIEIKYETKELLEGKKRKTLVTKRERVPFEETKSISEHLNIK